MKYFMLKLILFVFILFLIGCDEYSIKIIKYYQNPFNEVYSHLINIDNIDVIEKEMGEPINVTNANNGNISFEYNWGSLIYVNNGNNNLILRMLMIKEENKYTQLIFDKNKSIDDIISIFGKANTIYSDSLTYRIKGKTLSCISFTFINNKLNQIIISILD